MKRLVIETEKGESWCKFLVSVFCKFLKSSNTQLLSTARCWDIFLLCVCHMRESLSCRQQSSPRVVQTKVSLLRVDADTRGFLQASLRRFGKLSGVVRAQSRKSGDFPLDHLSPSSNCRKLWKARLASQDRPLTCFHKTRQKFLFRQKRFWYKLSFITYLV